MELWQDMLRQSVDSGKDLVERFGFNGELAERLNKLFHIRINPYYLSLIRYPGDPIWLQCIPDAKELEVDGLPEDPLAEDSHSPVPSIVHRYPDRVLFLTTSQCSMYCRFCTRKRKVGDSSKINMKYIQGGIDYIAAHPEVRDVICSGRRSADDDRLHAGTDHFRPARYSPRGNHPAWNENAVCAAPADHTEALQDAQEIPSGVHQYALQSPLGMHPRSKTGMRNARRCRRPRRQPGRADEGGE